MQLLYLDVFYISPLKEIAKIFSDIIYIIGYICSNQNNDEIKFDLFILNQFTYIF